MNKNNDKKPSKKIISKDIRISDLVESYPDVVEMLTQEWGFHCVNCIVSHFETLEEGALTHGIVGEDFEIMLEMINDIVANSEN
jgi:hybrid cluster-associated redox disulfide protein